MSLIPISVSACKPVRCHRCGGVRAWVCSDEADVDAHLLHRLERWVGELARVNVPCPRCCPLRRRGR
jgi:hypothetical protein